jgi:hypothetical protein
VVDAPITPETLVPAARIAAAGVGSGLEVAVELAMGVVVARGVAVGVCVATAGGVIVAGGDPPATAEAVGAGVTLPLGEPVGSGPGDVLPVAVAGADALTDDEIVAVPAGALGASLVGVGVDSGVGVGVAVEVIVASGVAVAMAAVAETEAVAGDVSAAWAFAVPVPVPGPIRFSGTIEARRPTASAPRTRRTASLTVDKRRHRDRDRGTTQRTPFCAARRLSRVAASTRTAAW